VKIVATECPDGLSGSTGEMRRRVEHGCDGITGELFSTSVYECESGGDSPGDESEGDAPL